MKEIIRYGFILGLICFIAGGLLVGVNYLTQGKIIAQAQEEERASLKEVLPAAVRFDPVKKEGVIIYYKGYGQDNNFAGVAFKAGSKGYSSAIEAMVGLDNQGNITNIKILSQNETPGLGARIVEPLFTGQFARKDIGGLDKVQAITGATISSKAVVESVQKKAEEIWKLLKDEK